MSDTCSIKLNNDSYVAHSLQDLGRSLEVGHESKHRSSDTSAYQHIAQVNTF